MKRLIVYFFFLLPISGFAQQGSASTAQDEGFVPPGATVDGRWNKAKDEIQVGSKIYVVRLNRLKKRSTCRVAGISEERLVCEAGASGEIKAYTREEIAALILPAIHATRPWVLGFLAGGGGLIAAACLAPITMGASIPIIILGSAMIVTTGAVAIGDNESRSEEFAYRRPGVDLSPVKLKN